MKNLESLKVMEKALTLDGTIIRISFEYHGNI